MTQSPPQTAPQKERKKEKGAAGSSSWDGCLCAADPGPDTVSDSNSASPQPTNKKNRKTCMWHFFSPPHRPSVGVTSLNTGTQAQRIGVGRIRCRFHRAEKPARSAEPVANTSGALGVGIWKFKPEDEPWVY